MPNNLSSDQLRQLARLGAQARLEELRTEMAAIQALIGEGGRAGARRGKLSAAGRRAIAAAQRARWAKIKAAKKPAASSPARRRGGRRGMSAAARKAASERMKKYWAARRATKK